MLTRSPSRLLGVAVTDLVGDRRTQNQPGTHREYPNWRIPLTAPDGSPLLLEDLPASSRARDLAARLRAPQVP
jgi:4-alpha-glucanotransferase